MKNMICIGCPKGCHLSIDEETLAVTGNSCPRGASYAVSELTNPTRTLTSTVKIEGAAYRRCPVKTDKPVPKGMVGECAKELDNITIKSPVNFGDVVISNVLGTGADVIVTRAM